jgi:hypothetical protein
VRTAGREEEEVESNLVATGFLPRLPASKTFGFNTHPTPMLESTTSTLQNGRAGRLAYIALTYSVVSVPHMHQRKNTFEDIASKRKTVSKMSAASWDRVGIISPSIPHSRMGVVLGVWYTGFSKVHRKLNIDSRGGRSPAQKRQNPRDDNSSSLRAQDKMYGSLS